MLVPWCLLEDAWWGIGEGVEGEIIACILHKRGSHLLQTTCHVQVASTLLCPCWRGPPRRAWINAYLWWLGENWICYGSQREPRRPKWIHPWSLWWWILGWGLGPNWVYEVGLWVKDDFFRMIHHWFTLQFVCTILLQTRLILCKERWRDGFTFLTCLSTAWG